MVNWNIAKCLIRLIVFVCDLFGSLPTLSLMSVETFWGSSSIKEWYGENTTMILFISLFCTAKWSGPVKTTISDDKWPFPSGWVPSTPPACRPWMSCGSMSPCICSAGLWCAATSHRRGSSKPQALITSIWPCCWSSSSSPLCQPSTPSLPFHLHLIADPSGNDASLRCLCSIFISYHSFSIAARTGCLTWSRRRWSLTSQPGSVKCSVMPLTLGWCFLLSCSWCKSPADCHLSFENVFVLIFLLPTLCHSSVTSLFRLAIYYLQSTSKSYKQANVELKKKLQMVIHTLV